MRSKKEFVSFCFVGGACFSAELGLLYLLTEYASISYLWSSAISFTVAVLINYILCQRFVFAGARNGVKQLVLFIATSVMGLGINQICMWSLVEYVGIHYILAKIVATGIVTVWNYVTKKKALRT